MGTHVKGGRSWFPWGLSRHDQMFHHDFAQRLKPEELYSLWPLTIYGLESLRFENLLLGR